MISGIKSFSNRISPFADAAFQWRHRWTGRGAQYRLCLEVVARLFRVLQGPMLQTDDAVLRMLHSCAVGLRVRIHRFLACLVHHPDVQGSGDQLWSLSAPVFNVHQLLHDSGLWGRRRDIPSFQTHLTLAFIKEKARHVLGTLGLYSCCLMIHLQVIVTKYCF